MDFIKRFHFIQKFKDNSNNNKNKNNATSLGRQKSKRSIFSTSHHNNDRHVSSNARHINSDDDDEQQEDDDDDNEYNSNTLIFGQKPLHAITISTSKPRTLDTSSTTKSKSTRRPTHQLYMQQQQHHHQRNSNSTVESQLLSLSSSNDVHQHKPLSIAFEAKGTKYPNKQHEKLLLLEDNTNHHKQEKSAIRHSEKTIYQDSTLYAPFIERPEMIEDDYIPLPTVTRKYIDPPPDVLLDSIPSFHHTHKRNQTHHLLLDNDSSTTAPTSPMATPVPLQKPETKLVINTKQLLEDDTSMADIGAWLSKNSAAALVETNMADIQQSVSKSTTF